MKRTTRDQELGCDSGMDEPARILHVFGEQVTRGARDSALGNPTLQRTKGGPPLKSTKRGEFFYYRRISAATSSPNFFWISFWVSGSKSVMSNMRRTSTISLSFPGMREAHSSASSRDFTWMIQ